MMKKRIFFLILALVSISFHLTQACMWDPDTLKQELTGLPNVESVIAGGTPRNPPLYYEMRIERLKKRLADAPNDLDAYDGIAVAFDRLKQSSDAILWMDKKKQAMDAIHYDKSKEPQPNHEYKYYANLGTFYAHRWLKTKDKEKDLSDIKKAEKLISFAIKENPNAHFGREIYQLEAISWIIRLHEDPKSAELTYGKLPNMLYPLADNITRQKNPDAEAAAKGLCGLIVMGDAWESIDIFYALSHALQQSNNNFAAFAALERVKELIGQGKFSIVPNTPKSKELEKILYLEPFVQNEKEVAKQYDAMREQAEIWQTRRTLYMQRLLREGKHPDTDDDFWSGFLYNPMKADIVHPEKENAKNLFFPLIISLVAIVFILVFGIVMLKIFRKKA
jgi:tetratricopeptide (TPR) repeat protein